jgi:hypothetical protein
VPAQAGNAAVVTHATQLLWASNAQAGLESMVTGLLGLCSSCSTKHLCWDTKPHVPVHGGALELSSVSPSRVLASRLTENCAFVPAISLDLQQ